MKKPKQDDLEQSRRFIEEARKLQSDESGEAFERALGRIAPAKKPKTSREGS